MKSESNPDCFPSLEDFLLDPNFFPFLDLRLVSLLSSSVVLRARSTKEIENISTYILMHAELAELLLHQGLGPPVLLILAALKPVQHGGQLLRQQRAVPGRVLDIVLTRGP